MRPLPLPRTVVDAALGLLVGVLALTTRGVDDFDDRGRGGPRPRGGGRGREEPFFERVDGLQLGAVAALVLALALRRTAPRTAYLGVMAATAAFLLAGGPYGLVLLGPALAVQTLMTQLPPRQLLPLLLLVPVGLSARFWSQPYGGLDNGLLYLAVVLGTAAVLLPGLVALVWSAQRDAERQDLLAERRRQAYEERLQIAREVHDVVGHSLAVINMQAGVALHVLQKRPDQLAPSLEAIRSTSKTALSELGSTLATLRGEEPARLDPTGPDAPPAGLVGLDTLVAALQAAGRTVRYSRPAGDELALPVTVQHAALRIAQEGLTNVVRHAAPDTSITLTIARQGPVLVVEVIDDGAAPPAAFVPGSGITGMRERARAVGGTVAAGPSPAGGFAVRAELPLDGRGGPA